MNKKLSVVLVLLMFAGALFSQVQPDESNILKMLEQSKAYYNAGEYEKAIAELEKALNLLYKLKQNDRVEAYKYLGFSYVAFGDVAKAKESFKLALSINPGLSLDPATVSPKIIQVFEQAKAEMPQKSVPPYVEPEPEEYKRVDYTGAMIRSAVLPGWGQKYKGDANKGTIFMAMTGGFVASGIISAIAEKKAHNAYKEDYNKHGVYSFWFNMTRLMFIGAAGTWAYAVFDAGFMKPSTKTSLYEFDNRSRICLKPEGIKISLEYNIKL